MEIITMISPTILPVLMGINIPSISLAVSNHR